MRTIIFLLALNIFCFFTGGCALLGSNENKVQHAENYQLVPPENWKVAKPRGECDHAYELPSGNTVSVTSSCDRSRDANLKTLTRQLLIGLRQIKVIEESEMPLSQGSGLFTHLQASSEGTPLVLGLAVVKIMGCVFDFSLVSKKPLSSAEKKDFLKLVKSLRYGND